MPCHSVEIGKQIHINGTARAVVRCGRRQYALDGREAYDIPTPSAAVSGLSLCTERRDFHQRTRVLSAGVRQAMANERPLVGVYDAECENSCRVHDAGP